MDNEMYRLSFHSPEVHELMYRLNPHWQSADLSGSNAPNLDEMHTSRSAW